MEHDEVLHERQAEPEPAGGVLRYAVPLDEQVEDPREQLGGDAAAVIGHVDLDRGAVAPRADGDRAAGLGVSRRVGRGGWPRPGRGARGHPRCGSSAARRRPSACAIRCSIRCADISMAFAITSATSTSSRFSSSLFPCETLETSSRSSTSRMVIRPPPDHVVLGSGPLVAQPREISRRSARGGSSARARASPRNSSLARLADSSSRTSVARSLCACRSWACAAITASRAWTAVVMSTATAIMPNTTPAASIDAGRT